MISPVSRDHGIASGPFVSIIVAVKNGAATIQRCLDSVREQKYPHRELIVIDGGSGDRTPQILNANAVHLADWESEPDRGIYHAWNKGVARARGEWICFFGADDRYAAPDSLARLADLDDGRIDLILAKMALVDASGRVTRVIGKPWCWEQMKRFPDIAHPGMLHRRTLFERYGLFDERYTIAGDYEFLMRLGSSTRAAFVPEVLVRAGEGGISRTLVRQVLDEVRAVQSSHPEIGRRRAALNYWTGWTKHVGAGRLRRPGCASGWLRSAHAEGR